MPYIPVDLSKVAESKPAPAGRYDLIITGVEQTKTREHGKPQLKVDIAIEGHDEAPNVMHFISLVAPGDEPKAAEFKKLLLERFLTLFRIPHTKEGFDTDDFNGARANAELTLDKPSEDKPDVYNRLQVPRLQDEENEAVRGARKAPKR